MGKLFNLGIMTVTGTPGTGTITLNAAASINGVSFLTFAQAGVADGDVVDYAIQDPTSGQSEIGTAPYTSAGTTLGPRTVTKSTNSNAAISASSASIVVLSPRAETLNDASLFTTGTLPIARLNGGTANQTVQGNGSFILQSRKLLNTLTASNSSSLTDTTSITAAFNDYEIFVENLVPVTNSVGSIIQVQVGGVFQTTGYVSTGWNHNTTTGGAYTLTNGIPISNTFIGNTAGGGVCGRFTLFGPNGTANFKPIIGHSWSLLGTQPQDSYSGGQYNGGTGAVTGLNFVMTSGNIASGTIKIYGLN